MHHLSACRVRIALLGALGSCRCQRTFTSPDTPTKPSLLDWRSVSPSPTRKSAEVATEYGFVVHEMEVMPDHVHLFVEADPTRSVAVDQRLQSAINRRHQYRPPVLGAPHDVVLQGTRRRRFWRRDLGPCGKYASHN